MLHPPSLGAWSGVVAGVASAGYRIIPERLAKELLAQDGVAVPRGVVGTEPVELLARATEAGIPGPYVLKVVSPTLSHKSDAGGVSVGLNECDVHAELPRMRDRVQESGFEIAEFLLEEQVHNGVEMVIGAVRDAAGRFIVMVGLGGVFIEVMEHVTFRIVPVDRNDIVEMIDELRGKELLRGIDSSTGTAVQAFVEAVYRIAGPGGVLETLPRNVQEVDLNPVVIHRDGAIAVDARFALGASGKPERAAGTNHDGETDFTRLFAPRSIAVLGASSTGTNPANMFIRNIRNFGFSGDIYPVHPHASEVEGVRAWDSLSSLPRPADYAFVALPARAVPEALATGRGMVHFAQVISSGFAEVEDGEGLEQDLVEAGAKAGVRILGPNCLGTHSPRGPITFVENADPRPGTVAVISQSGGLSVDILRLGHERGIRFSGIVSIGNGADVGPAELLVHFLNDPETEVIGAYLESLSQASLVLDVMRQHHATKPVVLLAGGRTEGGARAAQSHTGALAGNHRIWPTIASQAGMVLVDSLPEMLNALLAFQFCDKNALRSNSDVVLFGNGGGTSVLATDALERAGLCVPQLPDDTRQELSALGLPPGTSLANPLDAPAWTLAVDEGRVARSILATVLKTTRPALVISHFNVGIIASNTRNVDGDVMSGLIAGVAHARYEAPGAHHMLVLRPDGSKGTERLISRYQSQASKAGLPVFRDLSDAASAGRALVSQARRRLAHAAQR